MRQSVGGQAWGELVGWFVLAAVVFTAQQLLGPVVGALSHALKRRLDGLVRDDLVRAASSTTGVGPLEDQELLDHLDAATRFLEADWATPGSGAGGLAEEMRRRQTSAWNAASRVLDRAQRRALLPWMLGQLVFSVAYVGATLFVVAQAAEGRASVGDVILVIILAGQVNQQVAAAVAVLQQLQRGSRMMRTVDWVEQLVHRDDPADPRPVPERLVEGIRLDGVAFGYPDTEARVLDGVDLRARRAGRARAVRAVRRYRAPRRRRDGCRDGARVAPLLDRADGRPHRRRRRRARRRGGQP